MDAQAGGDHGIVQLNTVNVIGLGLDCPNYDFSGVGELWNRVLARHAEIADSGTAYGISVPQQGGARYIAGFASNGSVPEGMEAVELQGGDYYRLHFHDHPSKLGEAFGRLYMELIPASGRQPVQGGPCFEEYAGDWHEEAAGKFNLYIYAPLV